MLILPLSFCKYQTANLRHRRRKAKQPPRTHRDFKQLLLINQHKCQFIFADIWHAHTSLPAKYDLNQ